MAPRIRGEKARTESGHFFPWLFTLAVRMICAFSALYFICFRFTGIAEKKASISFLGVEPVGFGIVAPSFGTAAALGRRSSLNMLANIFQC